MNNLWSKAFNSSRIKHVQDICAFVDKLEAKGKLKWIDIYNDRFGPAGDTLIHLFGNQVYNWSQFGGQTLEQLTSGLIERDCKELIFAKNEFGMNGIDSIMYVGAQNNYYSDKSKFGKIFINKCKIDEEMVKQSYKKATLSRELIKQCNQSNVVKIQSILDKIRHEPGISVVDVINMPCVDAAYYDHVNVKSVFLFFDHLSKFVILILFVVAVCCLFWTQKGIDGMWSQCSRI